MSKTNKTELEKLQEAFYNFDDEKQGYLSIDDLRYIVTSDGNPLTGTDLEEFLAEADIFKNGMSEMCIIFLFFFKRKKHCRSR